METGSSAGSVLSAQWSLLPTPPPPSLTLLYIISHYNIDLHTIIRQQQEQFVTLQAQFQALIAVREVEIEEEATIATTSTKVARPQVFN